MDTDSVWQEEESWVEDITVEYYKNLFTSSNPTNFSKIVQAVQQKVTPDMNQNLTKVFNENEVKLALKQMYPLKGPGSNGMLPLFFSIFGQRWGIR